MAHRALRTLCNQAEIYFRDWLRAQKKYPLLIKAFSLVASKLAEYDLVIVASNPDRLLSFQKLAQDLNLADRIIVIGRIPYRDMVPIYNLADIFIFPSEAEGFGLPPLEAMACGTPTVAMNRTSLPEVLGNGALLIDGKQPEEWAQAIYHLGTDCDARKEWSHRAVMRASEYSWRKCAEETISVYEQVYEGKHLSTPAPVISGR